MSSYHWFIQWERGSTSEYSRKSYVFLPLVYTVGKRVYQRVQQEESCLPTTGLYNGKEGLPASIVGRVMSSYHWFIQWERGSTSEYSRKSHVFLPLVYTVGKRVYQRV